MPTRDGDSPPTASEMNEVMTIDSGDSARQANPGEANECCKTALRGNTLQTRRYLGVVYGTYKKDTQVLSGFGAAFGDLVTDFAARQLMVLS